MTYSTTSTATTTKQQQQASISKLTEPRRYTRDQIMAMARSQLAKGEHLIPSPSSSTKSVSTNPATPPTARMIC
ncbi:hypothetical protein PS6_003916 [Mucor atramentarius]